MKQKKKHYAVRLDPAMIEWLREETKRTGEPASLIIREGIRKAKRASEARNRSQQDAA